MKNIICCLLLTLLPFYNFSQVMEQTDKHFWNTLQTTAAPQKIWAIWTDVPNWNTWDTGLKDASIQGDFKRNAKGIIISLENRTSRFKVVHFEKGKTYTFKTRLPFGALYVKRYLDVKEGVTHFTHEVRFTGLTAGIFAKQFGPEFRRLLPEVMENVRQLAEK